MKIAVLMSGGIDSTFAALYLKKKGFDIFGITFLHIGKTKQKEEIDKVKKIAKELSIPHYVFKIRNIFEKEIISDFCETYKKGETPNPCSFCNKKIKFGVILKKAENYGAKKIATGHYVCLREEITHSPKFQILKAKDKQKDQSYFLWQLTQKELKKTIFPLGSFIKRDVFKEIKNSNLSKFFKRESNKERGYSESQGICFLEEKKLSDFLKEKLKKNPGPILNKDGKVLGKHEGVYFFTIGQRNKIKIGATSPSQRPLYVTKIDKKKNAIFVGHEENLYGKNLIAEDINWVLGKPPNLSTKIQAQIRYGHRPIPAIIKKFSKNKICIEFKKPQRAITIGQSVVFYKRDLLLGGGVIKEIIN